VLPNLETTAAFTRPQRLYEWVDRAYGSPYAVYETGLVSGGTASYVVHGSGVSSSSGTASYGVTSGGGTYVIHETGLFSGSGTAPWSPAASTVSVTTETRLVAAAPDPKKEYVAKQNAKHDAQRQLSAEIEARLRELITDAVLASEPLSPESLADLRLFMSQVSFRRRPAIYLLDNGNFRAVWKNADNEQAAFQFRGGGIVHCVFFQKRAAPQLPLNRETLVDVIPKVRTRLSDFEPLFQG
jgi:hypothetical protein